MVVLASENLNLFYWWLAQVPEPGGLKTGTLGLRAAISWLPFPWFPLLFGVKQHHLVTNQDSAATMDRFQNNRGPTPMLRQASITVLRANKY